MFSTSTRLKHTTTVPAGVPASKAIALLQDHKFFIECDPHMINFEASETPTPPPSIPADRQSSDAAPVADPKCYKVTDRVHALPAGLWDSDVVSTYEFIDTKKGVFVRTRSPLSVLLETVWEIRETEDGGYELLEDIIFTCSRLLAGVIKKTCEDGWQGIHEKMMSRLREEAKQESAGT